MMKDHADDVYLLGHRDIVRQKGALSSFHIPMETIGRPIWRRRYGKQQKSPEHLRCQREERVALQRHAGTAGCKLIINPSLRYELWGPDARACRLETLLRFLKSTDDDHCWVALDTSLNLSISVTILGNWFTAESLAGIMGRGYQQTNFTRHAPTIMNKIENFDAEFDQILDAAGTSRTDSRKIAMKVLEDLISKAYSELRETS
jgi:hypothetical protein